MTAVTFRPLARSDFALLAEWLSAPHIRTWWREDPTEVEANYGAAVDGQDATECMVVLVEGEEVGLLQRCRVADEPELVAALRDVPVPTDAITIDYLLGSAEMIGQGLGPIVLRAAVADIWIRYPDASGVIVSMQQDNRRSWRALEKIGFERVWAGMVVTDDPSDSGPSFVYRLSRPVAEPAPAPTPTERTGDRAEGTGGRRSGPAQRP